MKKKNLIRLLYLGALFLSSFPLFSQYVPPVGAGSVQELYSPQFLAAGASVVSTESPYAEILNPAISGQKQRIALDLNYAGLIGFTQEPGYNGHAANIGISIPTAVGVFSVSGHVLHSGFTSFDIGTSGGINASFAKDIYDDVLIGAGLDFIVGNNDVFDWALALDLGFIHKIGTIGFLKDFTWGASFQNIGKWFAPVPGKSPYPAPFTPAIGASFIAMELLNDKEEVFHWSVHSDLSFPSFQNIRFNLGTKLIFAGMVGFDLSMKMDLLELINGQARSFPLAGGVFLNFKTDIPRDVTFLGITERGWNRSEVKGSFSSAPLQNGIWAFGLGANIVLGVRDETPPLVAVHYPKTVFISPNNDGKADDLTIPVSITDERFVAGYSLRIYDREGLLVREILNKDERPENKSFENILQRLVAVKKGIQIPETIRWDGKNEDGALVPDGAYVFELQAWDDNGNTNIPLTYTVVVDSTPPALELYTPEPDAFVFSPNGDGNKDTFPIRQTGSRETLWKAEICDAGGTVVRHFSWENSEQNFDWDGKNDEGTLVADGVYTYRVRATDAADNTTEKTIENIIINTEATPISLFIDTQYFSPNNDGILDTIKIFLGVPVRTGIENWKLTIADAAGKNVWSRKGNSSIPEFFTWEGKSEAGVILQEGTYIASLEMLYKNGNAPKAVSPPFVIDVTPPDGRVTADSPALFSPDGDGNKDTIAFYQETTEESTWTGKITDESGRTVKTYRWVERPDAKVVWNGITDDGKRASDGFYTYTLFSQDKAGNAGTSNPLVFEINTRKAPVFLSAEQEAFSPNGDGIKDSIRILPHISENTGIQSYELAIRDLDGRTVKTYSGRGAIPDSFQWDGFSNSGNIVPDGIYYADIKVRYFRGNEETARTDTFSLDTQSPFLEARIDLSIFSPDGDGNNDSVTIYQRSSKEKLWEGAILNAKGNPIRHFFFKGNVSDYTWDGKDDAGNRVPDGTYTYSISATDNAGNTGKVSLAGITVDTRATPIFIYADKSGFSPNGDGTADTVTFNLIVGQKEGIESWQVLVLHENGTVQRSYSGGKNVPIAITWDGLNHAGAVVEGKYTATLTVSYLKGNRPSAKTSPFLLDVSGPELRIELSPARFSPDNDGVDDELGIAIRVRDASEIDTWMLTIKEKKEVENKTSGKAEFQYEEFYTFSGKGLPAEKLIWDGRSASGELVQAAEDYPYELIMTDSLGNTSVIQGIIEVDVLVIREGDLLKIKISSITFAGGRADLDSANQEVRNKNEKILRRLAEILNKYRTYRITIEGHANRLRWENEAAGKLEEERELLPLSLGRAESVRAYLAALGVDRARMDVKGVGGKFPVVPYMPDPAYWKENSWKNRRVEFILKK